jgi:hypothetical protein
LGHDGNQISDLPRARRGCDGDGSRSDTSVRRDHVCAGRKHLGRLCVSLQAHGTGWNPDSYTNADSDTHTYSNTYSNTLANSDAIPNPNTLADTGAHAYSKSDACPDTGSNSLGDDQWME